MNLPAILVAIKPHGGREIHCYDESASDEGSDMRLRRASHSIFQAWSTTTACVVEVG